MTEQDSRYRGCLLGLAVGDAMGYTVDHRTLEEIRRDYGPNGLLGYDLVNGYAEVTSHTQLAAYTANGLLMGATRGQLRGRMAPYIRYITLAQQEWATVQNTRREPENALCWITRVPEMRRRRCTDTRMLDTLNREPLGTMEEPVNGHTSPAAMTCAVGVGLFFQPDRMDVSEVGRLGAESVALTHGDPLSFLTGAALAYCIAGIVQDPETALPEQFLQSADAVAGQFGREYPQAIQLRDSIHRVVAMAGSNRLPLAEGMEHLSCDDSCSVLCGAMFACLTCGADFDSAMITAVNHSGCSAAVGAITGAILGASLGQEALPEFYLECLEPTEYLVALAEDLLQGCPLDRKNRLFDDDWDHKYIQAELPEKDCWTEE